MFISNFILILWCGLFCRGLFIFYYCSSNDGDCELARNSHVLLAPSFELPFACVCCFESSNALCVSSDKDLLAASMTDAVTMVVVTMVML